MISCGEPDENNLLANRWIGRVPRKGFHAVRGRNVFRPIPVSFPARLESVKRYPNGTVTGTCPGGQRSR